MIDPRSPDPTEASDALIFIVEDGDQASTTVARGKWKVAIIDDDEAVQDGTRFALFDYELDGHGLELLTARSGAEGRALVAAHPDIAVIVLDVVMESETAGLDLVEHIRRTLKNELVRIILRTGQPGQAPERSVIVDYDINDYKAKTELTATKLFTTITAALRSYHQLSRMVETKRGLEMIIDATASLGDLRSIRKLAEGVLTQIASLLDVECAGILVLREDGAAMAKAFTVLAGSGCYSDTVGHAPEGKLTADLVEIIETAFVRRTTEYSTERTVLFIGSESGTEMVALLDARKTLSPTDRALLGIFCNRLSASIDNVVLYDKVQEANRTLEARVEARTRELAASNVRLIEQWSRARHAKAFQNEIMSTVAHDLKNPLSVILGRTEILTQLLGMPPVAADRCVAQADQVREAAKRMVGMLDTLVADAMADAQDITIRREWGDIGELVRMVVEANRPLADRKRQQLLLREETGMTLLFDSGRLRDALDNIVSNAVKYSPRNADIEISVGRDGPDAAIRIRDHGPGLLPEDYSRLFGRFQRLSAKPTGGESSSGLGLFSAKRVVDLHNGTLSAESPGPGQGTTFIMRLPVAGPSST